MANATIPRGERQGAGDSGSLTRSQVAKQLGRDVSWVRRREGTLLHPYVDAGVHRFDPAEVAALRQKLMTECIDTDVAAVTVSVVHGAFERHSDGGERISLEGIAEYASIDPNTVRRLHKEWVAARREAGKAVRPLVSQQRLLAQERREFEEIERDYERRRAQYDQEEAAWRSEVERRRRAEETRHKAGLARRAASERARAALRAKHDEERAARMKVLQTSPINLDILDCAIQLATRTDVQQLMALLLRNRRGTR